MEKLKGSRLFTILIFIMCVQNIAESSSRNISSPFKVYHRLSPGIEAIPQYEVVMEWSKWTHWSKCTRSCGEGIQSRKRACLPQQPWVTPKNGIRTSHKRCSGEGIQYEVCAKKPCPADQFSALSFRAAQCRQHNDKKVFGRLINSWIPYHQEGINLCALVCEGEGEGIVYTFGKVIDGTRCGNLEGQQGMCVNGRCIPLSCDGKLGSTTREDMCRVCGGNNETCTRHMGVYRSDTPVNDEPKFPDYQTARNNKNNWFGYTEITIVPRGATNIRVLEHSSNFLALKSQDKYFLNGNWLIDWPGPVDAGGTTFAYSRVENNSETLSALGPTREDLVLMVLLREHNPGVYYEYWTPDTPTDSSFVVPHKMHHHSMAPEGQVPQKSSKSKGTLSPAAVLARGEDDSSNNSLLETKSKKRKKVNKTIFDKKGGKEEVGWDSKKVKTQRKEKTKFCGLCDKERRTKKAFCSNDFALRVEVTDERTVSSGRRYEVNILQSYKNKISLLHKEFLWVDNLCWCPRLTVGKTYIVMGKVAPGPGDREIRLTLNHESYVKRFSAKNFIKVLRLRRHERKNCHEQKSSYKNGIRNV